MYFFIDALGFAFYCFQVACGKRHKDQCRTSNDVCRLWRTVGNCYDAECVKRHSKLLRCKLDFKKYV